MYGVPSRARPRTVGTMTSRMMRSCIAGVTTGAGEYAPMPPVFGPASPSSRRLWSCDVASGSTCRAIDHHDEARFLALEEFLDDDSSPALPKRPANMSLRGRHRLVGRRADDDALAGRESVRLDDDRRAAARARRPRRSRRA